MAGRGTDIILGGNPTFKVKQIIYNLFFENKDVFEVLKHFEMYELDRFQKEKPIVEYIQDFMDQIFQDYKANKKIAASDFQWIESESKNSVQKDLEIDLENLPYSLDMCLPSLKRLYDFLYESVSFKWQQQNDQIKKLGGLFVLATERHETRRIDNQLRGRAGRQGDPGSSQFFVSLDDELIKVFGGDSIRRWINYLMMDPDVPLESNFLTQSLENAQKKVELYNYEIRKNVFQYDEVLNVQRKQLFQIRNDILSNNIYNELALRSSEFTFDEESKLKKENPSELIAFFEKYFDAYSTSLLDSSSEKKNDLFYQEIWISNDLRSGRSNVYQVGYWKNSQNTILLSIIDFYWTEHIERMNYIRDTINWRAYGQQNPLIEYNMEAFQSYKLMLEQIRTSMLYYFLENPILK
jgi:preprotein translocase subunit SecA